jgi:hypothetical protein
LFVNLGKIRSTKNSKRRRILKLPGKLGGDSNYKLGTKLVKLLFAINCLRGIY